MAEEAVSAPDEQGDETVLIEAAPVQEPLFPEPDESAEELSAPDDLDSAIAQADELVAAAQPEAEAGVVTAAPEAEPAEEPEAEPVSVPAAADASAATTDPAELATAPEPASALAEAPVVADSVPWWPFLVYDAVWAVFAVAMVYLLSRVPARFAAYDSSLYPLMIVGGLALTIAGPVLLVIVWLVYRRRPGSDSSAMFFSALVRGAVATLAGVAIWWAALIILDQLRLGRLF